MRRCSKGWMFSPRPPNDSNTGRNVCHFRPFLCVQGVYWVSNPFFPLTVTRISPACTTLPHIWLENNPGRVTEARHESAEMGLHLTRNLKHNAQCTRPTWVFVLGKLNFGCLNFVGLGTHMYFWVLYDYKSFQIN